MQLFQVTFDNGEVRVGTGQDVIRAICSAIAISNVERKVMRAAGEDTEEYPIVSSRNVVKAEKVKDM